MPISPTPIDALPTPVPSSADPANFDARADALLTALPDAVDQINDVADVTYDNAVEAVNAASAADASASIASSASGAAVWNAATNYASYAAAISPITYQTYRRSPPGGVDATDPSASSDWNLVGLDPLEYAATAGATFTGNLTVPSLNGGALGGFRNFAINGRARINQITGGSVTAITNNAYMLDMWAYMKSGAYVSNISTGFNDTSFELRRSDIRFIRHQTTTAVSSPGASDFLCLEHRMDSFDARRLIENTFTISFYVRSPVTGVHCVSLSNADNLRSYVAEYTVNAANTTEYKSITISGGVPDAATGDGSGWDFDFSGGVGGGLGLRTRFCLSSGSSRRVAAGAWEVGDFYSSSNQVNVAASTDASSTAGFAVTGLQIEGGSVATPYESIDLATDLMRCQRYYETVPFRLQTYMTSGSAFGGTCYFKTTKCKLPTVGLTGTTYTNAASAVTSVPATTGVIGVFATASSTALCNVNTTVTVDARL